MIFSAGAFLATIAGMSMFAGFGITLAAAKKRDPHFFNKGVLWYPTIRSYWVLRTVLNLNSCLFTGVVPSAELADTGAILALRALGWGTVYAIGGTSLLCYGIWKLSGAKDVSFNW